MLGQVEDINKIIRQSRKFDEIRAVLLANPIREEPVVVQAADSSLKLIDTSATRSISPMMH